MELDLHIVVRSLGVASSLRGFEKLKEVDIRLVLLGTISTVGIENKTQERVETGLVYGSFRVRLLCCMCYNNKERGRSSQAIFLTHHLIYYALPCNHW